MNGSNQNQFVIIDITALVQGWVNRSIPNYGLALALVGTQGSLSFDSKESTFTSHQPELENRPQWAGRSAGPSRADGTSGRNHWNSRSNGSPRPNGTAGASRGVRCTGNTWDQRDRLQLYGSLQSCYGLQPLRRDYVQRLDLQRNHGHFGRWNNAESESILETGRGSNGAPGQKQAHSGRNGSSRPDGPCRVLLVPQAQAAQQVLQARSARQEPLAPKAPQDRRELTRRVPTPEMIFPSFFPGNLSGTWTGSPGRRSTSRSRFFAHRSHDQDSDRRGVPRGGVSLHGRYQGSGSGASSGGLLVR